MLPFVWVGNSDEDEVSPQLEEAADDAYVSDETEADEDDFDHIKEFGTPENIDNLKRNLSKLILCVEMENWEKAEMFMETIRQLTEGAPREVSRGILRLKMAVQKANYEKAAAQYQELESTLENGNWLKS